MQKMKVSKLMEFNRKQIEKNFRERIKGLSSVFGPSGFEEEVAELIKQNLADSDFTHSTDVLGNLIYHRKGTGDKKILIAAHMDRFSFSLRTENTNACTIRYTAPTPNKNAQN